MAISRIAKRHNTNNEPHTNMIAFPDKNEKLPTTLTEVRAIADKMFQDPSVVDFDLCVNIGSLNSVNVSRDGTIRAI